MISFRFHVVSITAVFLAIAIGVVVGSTYVEGAVVDRLERRIDTVEHNADQTRAENGRLEDELGTARDFIGLSADFAVTDRLLDVPVAVLAVRGVDEGAVERTVVLARRAGAIAPGVIWLEPRWDLEGDGDVEALSEVLGVSADTSLEELQATAWDAVARELASEPDVSDPLEPASPQPEVLVALQEAGFVSTDALGDDSVTIDDLGGAGARVLVVTGSRAEGRLGEMVPIILDGSLDAGLITVVADVHVTSQEGPARAEALGALLEQQDLRDRVVLVDDADREEGRLAAVLALHGAAVASDVVGRHYGYGNGADAVLPSWTAP
jgi:hypothetical protein